jgi:SAM-dependent methyltransferase
MLNDTMTNEKQEWTKAYLTQSGMAFPSEYVIRIFKGSYPRLNFDKSSFKNKRICDVGCGDGRNMLLLKQCGFDVYGVEITKKIVDKVISNLNNVNINADVRVGTNDNIPFDDEYFDFLLSWNACYYMGNNIDFANHVKEFSRVLKKGGYLILSIPKKTNFIYKNSKKLKDGYRIIVNDPFKIRNGVVLRMFENEEEIKKAFSKYFENFIFGSIHDDCFGLNYHWHLVVCQKKWRC